MTTCHPAPCSAPTIIRQLSIEWEHRTISAADLRRVRAWQLPGREISSLDDVLDRCGFIRTAPEGSVAVRRAQRAAHPAGGRVADGSDRGDGREVGDVADGYMLRLLALARTDDLAARIVLQRILPALSAMARRHAASPGHIRDLLDDLVANAWGVIRTYPVERRPHWVVANLVRDIGFDTLVRPIRRRSAAEQPVADDQFLELEATTGAATALEELIALLSDAHATGVIDDADLQLLRELVNVGRADLVAAARQVTSRTVRNHRDAILHRLRNSVAVAA